ncbi:Panacea domain-containing protein [Dyadobacter soli]|uniref:Panacea domain-containing protein n=1 Tax=Dyadobacter soli TaxID=659014 RepID=UPI001C40AC95|nr:type II toxin-antitoxin system antitoxin SocA domain-containing protein [Dyadobacter soli]
MKHQKLLYYIQAWYLAFYHVPLFNGSFEAWIHGPVNRTIYDRYKDSKYIYSEMDLADITDLTIVNRLDHHVKLHVDAVLDAYAGFSATQLEVMTHQEQPWVEARKGYAPYERCETVIDNYTMQDYYSARLSS